MELIKLLFKFLASSDSGVDTMIARTVFDDGDYVNHVDVVDWHDGVTTINWTCHRVRPATSYSIVYLFSLKGDKLYYYGLNVDDSLAKEQGLTIDKFEYYLPPSLTKFIKAVQKVGIQFEHDETTSDIETTDVLIQALYKH
ncbi:MAG: hypothetical protein KatS3mg087_0489 [Patescibacteria group bacterium]|nr:MAG: hypothetical protein KatS3mg087_0489 [Patescibacteria group bacterium]